jgi:hypothetical protein
MLAVFRVYSHSILRRQSLSVVQSTYIFMYPHMHCCLLCCVGAWFVKLFYLLGLQHFYALCKHTLRQERRVLCVCVLEGYIIHIIVYIVKTGKGCSYTKVKKKVILFAKNIGTFLGLNIWWICVLRK